MVFVPLEFILNVYRIRRLSNLEMGTVNILIGVTLMVGTISKILLFLLTKNGYGEGQLQSIKCLI